MSSQTSWTLSLGVSLSLLLGVTALCRPDSNHEVKTAAAGMAADGTAKQAVRRIDLSTAVNVNLPSPKQDREATSFGTPDGKSGWVLRLPGGRPIATPAYADGMLFVGGGYGSHEFLCSGCGNWKNHLADSDGGRRADSCGGRRWTRGV